MFRYQDSNQFKFSLNKLLLLAAFALFSLSANSLPEEKSQLTNLKSQLNQILNINSTLEKRLESARSKNSRNVETLEKMSSLVNQFVLPKTTIRSLKRSYIEIERLYQQSLIEEALPLLTNFKLQMDEVRESIYLIDQSLNAEVRAEQNYHDSKMHFMMHLQVPIPLKTQRAYGLMEIAQQKRDRGQFQEALTLWQKSEQMIREAYDEYTPPSREQNKQNSAKIKARIESLVDAYLVDHLVKIPGGHFQIGSATGESNERPVHEVHIDTFYLGQTEVTFELYDLCARDYACLPIADDEGWGREDRPVVNVSYQDITTQFLPWLNEVTEQNYRLPSEAEWEFAARAGSTSDYSWGDNIFCSRARYNGGSDSVCDTTEEGNEGTYPVKSYASNAWGLYDMHGNVWEWVADCWSKDYHQAASAGSAQKSENCNRRVLRGGSWNAKKYLLRSSSRIYFSARARRAWFGFRLARDAQ